MGTGTSKHAAAATEEMKERLGVFELGRKEKYAGSLLSLILSQMLEENRFFNIMELLGQNGGCSTLFMVVQSTVEKEFLRLKIPDPERSSTVTSVVSVPQTIYTKSLGSRPSRTAICNNISHFLVRLITLMAALTASIKTNQTMKGLISPQSLQKDEPKKLKDLDTSQIDIGYEEKKIPDFLIKQGVFIKVQENKYILPMSDYVILFDKMILYNADKNVTMTNVYKIIFEKTDYKLPEIPRKTSPQSMPVLQKGPSVSVAQMMGASGMGTAGAGPAFGIGAGLGPKMGIQNNSTYISERTASSFAGQSTVASRRRHSTRRLRKLPGRRSRRQIRQWGGQTEDQTDGQAVRQQTGQQTGQRTGQQTSMTAGKTNVNSVKNNLQKAQNEGTKETKDTLYKVIISPIAPTPGPVIDFLLNSASETYETNEVRAYFDPVRQSPFPRSEALYNRIAKLFQTEGRFKIAFPAPSEPDESKKEFMTLHSKTTLEKIKKSMENLNKGSETGTAPAPYRAFLLATETSGSEIGHLLCSDKWSGQWLTSVMAYSLLQSLFNDTIDENMTPQSAEACSAMMNDFIKTGAVYASPQTGTMATSLNNLRFQNLPETLRQSVCQQSTILKTESLPENVAILKKAHHDLRLLYEAYIDKIFAFTQTIVKPYRTEKDGKLDYIFKIDPAFFTTEGTSQEYLEKKIAEARILIGSHLIMVEKIYHDAINKLALSKKGIKAVPTPVLTLE